MARRAAVTGLGKELSRRARSRCELCGQAGSLGVVEPAPAPLDPQEDRALLLCGRCAGLLELKPGRPLPDEASLRFLTEAIWAENPLAVVVAVRLLRAVKASWGALALDDRPLEPELEAWVDGAPPDGGPLAEDDFEG